jgi:DNA gyrase subunit B
MDYTVDDIKIISWPEPVRKRPEMYYKHLGSEGCVWLMEEILESILNEKYFCNASIVEIRYTRHDEVVVEYNGKGIPIDISNDNGIPEPIIYSTLTGLACGGYSEEDAKKYGHLLEIGAILNAACKVLRIYCSVKNKYYGVSFYQGCISSPLRECSSGSQLNKLQFKFDSSVMGEFEVTEKMFKTVVETVQSKYKNAQVRYIS